MKLTRSLAIAMVASLSLPALAGFSIGGFGGIMDTELLGEGVYYGGQIEFGVEPLSFILRAGCADEFDAFESNDAKYSNVRGITDRIDFDTDDFCVIPLEFGALLRFPEIIPMLGIYGGGGVGYYYIPALDIYSGHHRVDETDPVDDLVGWWACGGVELNLDPLYIFAEAKYVDACDDVEIGWGHYHTTTEVDLSGWTALIGVRIGW